MILIFAGNSRQAEHWAREQRIEKRQYRIVHEPYFNDMCGYSHGTTVTFVGSYYYDRRDYLEALDYAKARGFVILHPTEIRPKEQL